MSIDMTCALFAFHSQQVKQSAYDNLPPLLTTPFSSLVMNMLVLDLRPVWRWEGCWQRRSFRERCVRQHFQVRRHLRQYRRPVVGLFLLPGSEGRDWTWRSSWAVEWRDPPRMGSSRTRSAILLYCPFKEAVTLLGEVS